MPSMESRVNSKTPWVFSPRGRWSGGGSAGAPDPLVIFVQIEKEVKPPCEVFFGGYPVCREANDGLVEEAVWGEAGSNRAC